MRRTRPVHLRCWLGVFSDGKSQTGLEGAGYGSLWKGTTGGRLSAEGLLTGNSAEALPRGSGDPTRIREAQANIQRRQREALATPWGILDTPSLGGSTGRAWWIVLALCRCATL